MARKFASSSDLFQYVAPGSILLSELWDLYIRSDSISALLDQMTDRGDTLSIIYQTDLFAAETYAAPLEEHARGVVSSTPTIYVDPSFFNDIWFADSTGYLHRGSLTRMLGHELIHALTGAVDNLAARYAGTDSSQARAWLGNPQADFFGDTVGKFGVPSENNLGVELGGLDAWFRASYLDAINGPEFDSLASSHLSLTDGNFVEDVFFDFEQPKDGNTNGIIAFNARGKSALIFAGVGADNITGGSKADYIYGGKDDDTLHGSGGNDFLAGGLGYDFYYDVRDGDTILDSSTTSSLAKFTGGAAAFEGDGRGKVLFSGITLKGATRVNGGCDDTIGELKGSSGEVYQRQGADLYVFYQGKTLTIKDFVNGDLGITLDLTIESCPPRPPTPGSKWPPSPPPPPRDPLVLDLDGNGIVFTAIDDSTAYYDYAGTGFAIKTGWIGPNDGFLVEDLGNGKFGIFGNPSQDGFVDLARFDANHDGSISSADTNFGALKVWRDLDSDGTTDDGEVVTLQEAGVVSVSLANTRSGDVIAGTTIGYKGTFTRTDGSTGLAETAYFQADTTFSRWIAPPGFVVSAEAELLPEIKGYGDLQDWSVAMTLRPELLAAVKSLVFSSGSLSSGALRSAFEQLLFKWANVENETPGSHGPNIDARVLSFMETFWGREILMSWFAIDSLGNPTALYASFLMVTYNDIVDSLLTRFLTQAPLSQFINGGTIENFQQNPYRALMALDYDPDNDTFTGSLDGTALAILDFKPNDPAQAVAYFDKIIGGFGGVRDIFFNGNPQAYAAGLKQIFADVGDQALLDFISERSQQVAMISTPDTNGALVGGTANDLLHLAPGVSRASAGAGDDTYVYVAGSSGDVTIDDVTNSLQLPADDKLDLVGVKFSDVSLSRDDRDLLITIKATGKTITISDQFSYGGQIETLVFADGVMLNPADVREILLANAAALPVGIVRGFDQVNDDIEAGIGGKTLAGGGGSDTYVVDRYSGDHIIIDGSGSNTLKFGPKVAADDLRWNRVGDDLVVHINDSKTSVTIANQFGFHAQGAGPIESFVLANGTVLTLAQVLSQVPQDTTGNDTIDTSSLTVPTNVIHANAGDDYYFTSFTSSEGVPGKTYVFEAGFGHDVIDGNGRDNIISFGASINPANVQVQKFGEHIVLTVAGSNDRLIVTNNTVPASSIAKVTFANGTEWSLPQIVQSANQVTEVIAPNGVSAAVNYSFGSSAYIADTITSNTNFTLNLHGVTPDNVDIQRIVHERDGASIFISVKGQPANGVWIAQTSSLVGLGAIKFDDGSIWSRQYVQAYLIQAASSSGDDLIQGFDFVTGSTFSKDILIGGAGNDALQGGDGDDIYIYSRGHGFDSIDAQGQGFSKLKFTDITSTDVELQFNPNTFDLIINIAGTPGQPDGQIRLISQLVPGGFVDNASPIDEIVFSDGIVWHQQDIIERLSARQATSSDDSIYGTQYAEVVQGGLGNDHLYGGNGGDTYVWSWGDGRDYVQDDGDSQNFGTPIIDKVVLHGVLPSEVTVKRLPDGTSFELVMRGNHAQSVVIRNRGVEEIVFDNGTVWTPTNLLVLADHVPVATSATITGTSGDDTLSGTNGIDVFDGGAGNDILKGATGYDTYLFGVGSGHDTIDDEDFSGDRPWTSLDTINLVGLNPDDVEFAQRDSDIVVIIRATGETLTIQGDNTGSRSISIERYVFADGTMLTARDVAQRASYLGTAASEAINVWFRNDNNAHTFEGRQGNDTISGSLGADTYIWRPGDGNDTIYEDFYSQHDRIDTLWIQGVSPSDVSLSRSGEDLRVTIISTGEVITDFHHARGGIEVIKFDDGTIWNRDNVLELAGSAGVDYLFGTDGSDQIEAGAGDDRIGGDLGNDTIIGGAGADDITGGLGSDRYIWKMGDGNDLIRGNASPDAGAVDRIVLRDVMPSGISVSLRDWVPYISAGYADILVSSTGEVISVDFTKDGILAVDKVVFSDGSELDLLTSLSIPNIAPQANVDWEFAQTDIDQTLVINTSAILANDKDFNGDTLSIIDVYADYGTAILNQDGTITFIPDVGFEGYDYVNYILSDGSLTDESYVEIFVGTLPPPPGATAGDDVLEGTSGDDTIDGLAGNDELYGFAGNDTLIGGQGADWLYGEDGSDTYVITRDAGVNDVIFETFDSAGEIDTVRLVGFSQAEATLSLVYDDFGPELRINLPDGQRVTFREFYAGEKTIEKIVFDGGATWDAGSINGILTGNSAPVAAPYTEHITTNEDHVVSGILLPGSDANSDRLTFQIVEGAALNGTVTLLDAVTGRYLFRPNTNFNGEASFRYTVSDGIFSSAPKTVGVTVTAVADAPLAVDDAGFLVANGGSLAIETTALLANDTAVEGGPLSLISLESLSGGTAVVGNDGVIAFQAATGFEGNALLRYTVADSQGSLSRAYVTIAVQPPLNRAPVVSSPGTINATEDTTFYGRVVASDADGDTLNYTIKSGFEPQKGTVSISPTGAFRYVPTTDANGSDFFTVVVSDGRGGTTEHIVGVSIAPTDDSPAGPSVITLTADEDGSASGAINAIEADGEAVVYSIKSGADPSHGTVALNSDGSFVYNPATNFYGTDNFTVQFRTNGSSSYETLVTINVRPINDAPNVAAPLADQSLPQGTEINFVIPAESFADVDRDSLVLTATLASGFALPVWLVFDPVTKTFNGTPPTNFGGTFDIRVTASDGILSTSDIFKLTIEAANVPAVLSSADVTMDETNAALSTGGTLTITDVDNPATFVAQTNVAGSNGTFSITSAGAWTYTANSAFDNLNVGQSVSDTFTVAAADGTTTTVKVTINGTNDAAVLSSAVVALNETNAALSTGGTLTITDVDNPATFVAQTNVAGTNGTFSITSAGAWTYTANSTFDNLNVGQSVSDTFTVAAADGTTTTVKVTINGTNDAAVLSSAVVNLNETNTALSTGGTLTITDVDNPATFVAQTNVAGTNGTFSITSAGAWTYTANSAFDNLNVGQSVSDTFTVAAADGTTTTVKVTINGTNDAAVLSSAVVVLSETNSALSTGGTLTITDVDNPATFVAQTNVAGTNGTFSITSAGAWTYTANSAFDNLNVGTSVSDTFTVAAADGTTTTVKVTINGTNDAAVLSSAVVVLNETNAALSTGGTFTITDVDNPATFVAQTNVAGTNGTFSITSAGAWTYTANSAFDNLNVGTSVSDTFTVVAADGTTTTVKVTINGTNDAAVLSSAVVALNETNAALSTGGTLTITDVDNPATFVVQTNVAGANGTFAITSAGAWTYTANSAFDNLNVGTSVSDTFTVAAADGTTTTVKVTINGTNDAPVVSGAVTANATEDGAVVTVNALSNTSDVDTASAALAVTGLPATLPAGVTYNATAKTFSINPADAAYQHLAAGATQVVTINYSVTDGIATTPASVSFTVIGTNDGAVIAGTATGSVTEDTTLTATGTLTVTDVDDNQQTFQAATIAGAYGSLTIGTNGAWTYTLNNSSATVQALNTGQSVVDTINVASADGTTKAIAITVNGLNEPVTGGVINGTNSGETIQGTAGNDTIDAKGGSDIVFAGSGNDIFLATLNDGNDSYNGEGGSDTYNMSQITAAITVSLGTVVNGALVNGLGASTSTQSGTDILTSIENVIGGSGNDTITGDGLANTLNGGAGADTLDGGAGADTLIGGLGNDIFVVDNIGDVVTEAVNEGTDTIRTSLSSYSLAPLANVENLTGIATTGQSLTGNGGANVITCGSGNDTLDGGAGADTLIGGAGNDTYVVDNVGDVVTEAAGAGTDTIQSSITFTLASLANIENLSLIGTAIINATGNATANVISGNSAANVINGGLGSDTLTGGAGADTFVFNATLGATNVDRILDFSVPDDTLSLENTGTGLFTAISATGTLAANAFWTGTAAHLASDRIIYNATTGDLFYDADGMGATAAVRFATLQSGLALTYQDFMVT